MTTWSAWSGPTAATASEPNRFGVATHRDELGWRVTIVDHDGRELSTRSCADEVEARTYASTVRQHVEWLSEEKFREYYGLSAPEEG